MVFDREVIMAEYDWKFDGDVKYRIEEVHIETICAGDTVVLSDGLLHTVCKKDLTYDPFMGVGLFGYNYKCGHEPVKKAIIYHAR